MNRNAAALLTFLVLFILFARAITYATPKAVAKNHTQCTKQELRRRDCLLHLFPFQLQLSRPKITWSDGTWTNIADAPLPDENYQWDKVTVEKINGRLFLQYWIWDAGKGEAKVQSLHWIVGELKEKNLITHFDRVVRKREVRDTNPVSYNYDRPIPHFVKKMKGEVQWTIGPNAGKL